MSLMPFLHWEKNSLVFRGLNLAREPALEMLLDSVVVFRKPLIHGWMDLINTLIKVLHRDCCGSFPHGKDTGFTAESFEIGSYKSFSLFCKGRYNPVRGSSTNRSARSAI